MLAGLFIALLVWVIVISFTYFLVNEYVYKKESRVSVAIVGTLYILVLIWFAIDLTPVKQAAVTQPINDAVLMFDGRDTCVVMNYSNNNDTYNIVKFPKPMDVLAPLNKISDVKIERSMNIFGKTVQNTGRVRIKWQLSSVDTGVRYFNDVSINTIKN
jgi:hypothetical protein